MMCQATEYQQAACINTTSRIITDRPGRGAITAVTWTYQAAAPSSSVVYLLSVCIVYTSIVEMRISRAVSGGRRAHRVRNNVMSVGAFNILTFARLHM